MLLFGLQPYSKDRPMFSLDLFDNPVVERAGLTDFESLVDGESDEDGVGDSVVALEQQTVGSSIEAAASIPDDAGGIGVADVAGAVGAELAVLASAFDDESIGDADDGREHRAGDELHRLAEGHMGFGCGLIGDDRLCMGKLTLGGTYALAELVDEVLIVC